MIKLLMVFSSIAIVSLMSCGKENDNYGMNKSRDILFHWEVSIKDEPEVDYYAYDSEGNKQGVRFLYYGDRFILLPYKNNMLEGLEIRFNSRNQPNAFINHFKNFVVGQQAWISFDSLGNIEINEFSYCQPYFDDQMKRSVCIIGGELSFYHSIPISLYSTDLEISNLPVDTVFKCLSCSFTFVGADSVYAEGQKDTSIDYVVGFYQNIPDTLDLYTFFFCPGGSECELCVEAFASNFRVEKICKSYDFSDLNIVLRDIYYKPFYWILFPTEGSEMSFNVISKVIIRNRILDTVIVKTDTTYVILRKIAKDV